MGSSRQKGHWEHALDFLEARCRQRHCGGTWLGSYEQWCSVSKPLCIFDGIYTPSAVYRPDAGKMCIAINFCLVATHGCNVMSERLFPFLLVLQAKKALSTRHGQQWNQVASVGVGPSTVLLNGEAHLESWNTVPWVLYGISKFALRPDTPLMPNPFRLALATRTSTVCLIIFGMSNYLFQPSVPRELII